jgi:DNA-binding response OmpR family regulator
MLKAFNACAEFCRYDSRIFLHPRHRLSSTFPLQHGKGLLKILIVEDNPGHIAQCVEMLEKFPNTEVSVARTVALAVLQLEDARDNKVPAPDLIVLDLDFYGESGFEVLRLWRGDEKLKRICIIVWTEMGEKEQQMCEYFGVHTVVPKHAGLRELETAIRFLDPPCAQTAAV